ncbi:recombinase family protein [Pseudomonas fluorescens]|uniref:Transposon gamma-delta resolvase n=1 Tax=Pseudomonas fluorescens TaxID=294 RepID=A0A5E7F0G5_PSEFL|nr:recombinase family protein [Pseudomonas fluorescens]VVO32272.1 Transposon gamma-delta resolvase [Pseudomonas fluorescens]
MDIGYIRVSSVDQNTVRQLDGVALDKVFTDKVSGGTVDRPQLAEMRRSLRAGDTLHVHSIDRLARSLADLLALVEEFTKQRVKVKFHKEDLTFTGSDDKYQNLMLQMMGAVAQFERSMIRERQAEGIAKAKEAGVYERRAKAADHAAIRVAVESGLSFRAAAKDLGVSLSTVQRVMRG